MNFNINLPLIISLCLELIITSFAKNVKIIGGEEADIRDFPHMASFRLYRKKFLICGGAIISNRHILTAAHCFQKRRKCNIRVYLGTNDSRNYSIPFYKIQNIHIHPQFRIIDNKTQWTVLNDVAVVRVEPNIEFNEFQNKIDLPTENIQSFETGVITGWGWKSFPRGTISDKLQKLSMAYLMNAKCDNFYPHMVNDNHICTIHKDNFGVCVGDSGGPLISNGKVIGICSFGRSCFSTEPDVYTKIYAYVDFITSSMTSTISSFSCIQL